jgi:flagellar protein FlaI
MDHPRTEDFDKALDRHPHLRRYIDDWRDRTGRRPEFTVAISRDADERDQVDLVYPVGDPLFIHVHGDPAKSVRYAAIEPELEEKDRAVYEDLREQILQLAPYEEPPQDNDELRDTLDELYERVAVVGGEEEEASGLEMVTGSISTFLQGGSSVSLSQEQYDKIRYFLHRDIVNHGPLEPIIRDPYIEDIHAIGLEPVRHIHEIFDMMETNVSFRDFQQLDEFLRTMGERIGRPVSESNPIVDATLPDGSRINIVYSDDVSLKGSSFTIRKFQEDPLSITQITKWGTMSPRTAAYIWLCLEYGQSVFVCGETASGKTTSLNAFLPFIQPDKKVYTAEDTPEVRAPQPTWQQLATREQGPEDAQVDMFDLLKTALRSRPEYIIVGEIRGAEGNVAFQAMQTGHPVMATFHASSVQKMIQRLSSEPINVPETFMDNLNVALIQMAVYQDGQMLRRVLGVHELEGYSDRAGGVLTRQVFNWDPKDDKMDFRGRNNSYVLEERIAQVAGYDDKRQIYEDLDLRTRVIERMIEEDIMDYYDVKDVIWRFYEDGVKGLPFTL